jgi:hypothetical protein
MCSSAFLCLPLASRISGSIGIAILRGQTHGGQGRKQPSRGTFEAHRPESPVLTGLPIRSEDSQSSVPPCRR